MPSTLTFPRFNAGYNRLFQPGKLSIGLVVPIAGYALGNQADMSEQLRVIQYAEQLGFAGVWLRDIPFHVPQFADDGQVYDPFVYLGALAVATRDITLGVASLILPLRHPAHVAKAAASVDQLSAGRLVLGVASGDRADEYPAMQINYAQRGTRFRDSFNYIRQAFAQEPQVSNGFGSLQHAQSGLNIYPKPVSGNLPLLITGASQQDMAWQTHNADGLITYPRAPDSQRQLIDRWRELTAAAGRPATPVMQPLYIDLTADPTQTLSPMHLGVRGGVRSLALMLRQLQHAGVNHVCLNLRFNQAAIMPTLKLLASELLPEFTQHKDAA